MWFLCALIVILSYIKMYALYNRYETDKENKKYVVVVVQNLGEDESKVRYLVKLKLHSFILNIYKENKFSKETDKKTNKDNYSTHVYGDELSLNGKIVKTKIYGNPRRI